jgi:hypothetical protein
MFLKVPLNFEGVTYKDRRLYCRYLDFKAQSESGVFKIYLKRYRRTYYRDFQRLIDRGWASPCHEGEDGSISLRAYQYVWRDLGIQPCRMRGRHGKFGYNYYKLDVDLLPLERGNYLKAIEDSIRKKQATRQAAQMRWSLKRKGMDNTKANFGANAAARLFGYKSASSGSKVRKQYFSVIEAPSLPYFNCARGRYEEPVKQIAL